MPSAIKFLGARDRVGDETAHAAGFGQMPGRQRDDAGEVGKLGMPRRIADSRIGAERMADDDDPPRALGFEPGNGRVDLGHRLVVGGGVAPVERPRHFRRSYERAFILQRT